MGPPQAFECAPAAGNRKRAARAAARWPDAQRSCARRRNHHVRARPAPIDGSAGRTSRRRLNAAQAAGARGGAPARLPRRWGTTEAPRARRADEPASEGTRGRRTPRPPARCSSPRRAAGLGVRAGRGLARRPGRERRGAATRAGRGLARRPARGRERPGAARRQGERRSAASKATGRGGGQPGPVSGSPAPWQLPGAAHAAPVRSELSPPLEPAPRTRTHTREGGYTKNSGCRVVAHDTQWGACQPNPRGNESK